MMELLAPAGGYEALTAAVQNGADAVYMGFGAFNARRSAKNFTDEEFASAVRYCHLRGVRVFLTLNTLLTDRELPGAAAALRKASAMGVDAVLVQDWGLLTLAKEIVPDLPLHASTQMSLFTLGGANAAAALGMERVVLARELDRDEVREICAGCGAEIEVFGHGALCMCYSGQCEMSAVLGQRSGNRGACAQPCRLPYGVNGPCRDAHPLSLKDANLSAYLRDMASMGVACLKLSNSAGFSGKQQFTCSYTLPCRAAEAADGQQFRLSLPETGWDYAIDSYTLTMTFPAEVTNAPEWTSGYYGDVVDNYLDIRTQENTVTAKSTAAMRDHETLTVAVQFPADTFNLRDQPGKTAGFDRIAFLVLLAAAVAFWFLRLRSGLILPRAQQTIGMESTAGEIPCQLLGEAPDAAGMIVHWGNLGYLTVRMSRGRVILYKRMEMGNERKPSERRFFAALFRAGASCEAGGLRYQAAVREMQAPILTGWRRRMFTGGNPLVLRLLGAAAGLFASLLTFDRLLPATGSRWVWLPVLTALGTAACVLVQRGVGSLFRRRRALALALGGLSAIAMPVWKTSG